MGAETTFIDRFTPPAIASMAYLPCCDEWVDTREMEECPFCGLDLEKVWGPDLMLVAAIFKFDRLEVEGGWSMKQALSAITSQAKSEVPHIDMPEGLDIPLKHLQKLRKFNAECPVCGKEPDEPGAYDGWPCEGWDEERRAMCRIEFTDCSGKPDCPRNRSLIGDLDLDEEKDDEEEEREPAGDKYQNP